MKIKMQIGDWSNDGHNQSQDYILSITGSTNLEKDYVAGMRKVGFDLTEYCLDYEDNYVPKALIDKVWELGFEFKTECYRPDFADEPDNDLTGLWADEYVDLYMTIAAIGNNNLKYEIVGDDLKIIRPGGYGLFYN